MKSVILGALFTCLMLCGMIGSTRSLMVAGSATSNFRNGDTLHAPDVPRCPPESAFDMQSIIPGYYETSEYLIGKVAVGIVFLESNGSIDASTETWTYSRQIEALGEIQNGLSILAGSNPDAHISFVYDVNYFVPTSYEPINHPYSYQAYWISQTMTFLGYPGTFYFTQVRDYMNDLRETLKTDWSYAIFVVDSYNDADGKFTDGYSAYAYLGGPFLVMTYDNDGYGIGNMDWVTAHETAHIFYATDEYDNVLEYSGYLNSTDTKYTTDCLMGQPLGWPFPLPWGICANTRTQLGWRDLDGDRIQDIVDRYPSMNLNPYLPDPTNNSLLTYYGSVSEIPYPNRNPHGTGRSVTINILTNVKFRVDYGVWIKANATDGIFDEAVEDFTFTTQRLLPGTHTVEAKGINCVNYAGWGFDTVNVLLFDDGFESGNFSAWSGTSVTPGETRRVTTDFAYRGRYGASFYSNGTGGSEAAFCYETITAQGELYARAYFRVSASGISALDSRFFFIIFRAGSTSVAYAGWRKTAAGIKWILTIRDGANGFVDVYSSASPSMYQWYCVELHWKKDSSYGMAELWVNGALVCSTSGKNTAVFGDVNLVRMGLSGVVNCASTKLYADCAKIATTLIGKEP